MLRPLIFGFPKYIIYGANICLESQVIRVGSLMMFMVARKEMRGINLVYIIALDYIILPEWNKVL